jgi:hypothetical protein
MSGDQWVLQRREVKTKNDRKLYMVDNRHESNIIRRSNYISSGLSICNNIGMYNLHYMIHGWTIQDTAK